MMNKFADAGQDGPDKRFHSQAATGEELLKNQTVGLVNLADFRKRRAAALEAEQSLAGGEERDVKAESTRSRKKKSTAPKKGPLSFEDEDQTESDEKVPKTGPNATVAVVPKALTKGARMRELETREHLRREFLAIQETVKATEIVLPFVFFDGANLPGGACKMRKGDHIWLFLERSRKVGANQGAGQKERSTSRKEWARVSVDDLMLVRGEVIVPHHFDFYHFLINKIDGRKGRRLFEYSSTAELDPNPTNDEPFDPLSSLNEYKQKTSGMVTEADSSLEGYHDDPTLTKVVDRRWYERNKHIYPASVWEEYDPNKPFSNAARKDAEGNAMFFS